MINNIDFDKVKGYSKLTEKQQELFKSVYERHNACLGRDYREAFTPICVKEDHRQRCLIVRFKNGEWLHYTAGGDWY